MRTKIFLVLLVFVCVDISGISAQQLICPNGYMLMNVSSSKCKLWATTTTAVSVFDGDKSEFKVVVYPETFISLDDSMAHIFLKEFIQADSFQEIRLTTNILDFDKLDRKKEFTAPIKMKGTLMFHGVTKDVAFEGNIHYRPKLSVIDYVLYIPIADFGLVQPKEFKKCLSPTMEIKGNASLYFIEPE